MTTRKPRQNPDYRLAKLDNEILLYHPGRTQVIYLNETASMIWKLCDGKRTTLEITEILQGAFPEDAVRIGDEVKAALRSFVEQDAMELV
jgi:hypothetical protein